MLDTDILIDLSRKNASALLWLQGLTVLPSVPGIVALEFLFGVLNNTELRDARILLSQFNLAWPVEADMLNAATSGPAMKLTHGMGMNDMIIASMALRLGEDLATFNVKHFRNVPGLTIVQPYIR